MLILNRRNKEIAFIACNDKRYFLLIRSCIYKLPVSYSIFFACNVSTKMDVDTKFNVPMGIFQGGVLSLDRKIEGENCINLKKWLLDCR